MYFQVYIIPSYRAYSYNCIVYCSPVCSSTYSTCLIISSLQKQVIKIICRVPFRTSSRTYFQNVGILPFECILFKQTTHRYCDSLWLVPLCGMGFLLSQTLLPRILSDTFYSSLKTLLFSRARVGSASE